MHCIPAGWPPATGFGSNRGWKGALLHFAAICLAISGARTIVYLATAPEVSGVTGRYFVRERESESSAASQPPRSS
jgi:hypothetical protein